MQGATASLFDVVTELHGRIVAQQAAAAAARLRDQAVSSRITVIALKLSVEAQVAARSLVNPDPLADCVSARELRAAGFSDDVDLAFDVDASGRVPVRLETEASHRAFAALD
jgi:hypothetical protein